MSGVQNIRKPFWAFIIVMFMGSFGYGQGEKLTSVQSGSWNKKGTWDKNETPGKKDTVVISSGDEVTAKANPTVVKLVIEQLGTLDDNGQNVEVTGDLTLNGTYKCGGDFTVSGGAEIEGTGTVFSNGGTWKLKSKNKLITSNADLVVQVQTEVHDNITINNTGTIRFKGQVSAQDGKETWLNSANSKLFLEGQFLSNGTLDATASPNTVGYMAPSNSMNIKDPVSSTYHHLVLGGSSDRQLQTETDINGDVTIKTANFKTQGYDLTVGGDWTNKGTFKHEDNKVTFDGSSDQRIEGAAEQTFRDLELASGGKVTSEVDIKVLDSLTLSGNAVDMTDDTLELGKEGGCGSTGILTRNSGTVLGWFGQWINGTGDPSAPVLYPVGTASNYRPANITFNTVGRCGMFFFRFVPSDPGNSGLPLTDADGVTVYNSFIEGYWESDTANDFSSGDYDVEFTGTGFSSYTITDSTRVVTRSASGNDWTLEGDDTATAPDVAARNNLTTEPAQFAFADTTDCSPPSKPSDIFGNNDVCKGDSGLMYYVSPNPPDTFSWDVTEGSIVETDSNDIDTIYVEWNNVGKVGDISVTQWNDCSNSPTYTEDVTIHSIPPSSMNGPTTVAENQTGVTYSVTNQSGYSYTWTVTGGGTITSGQGTNQITVDWGSAGTDTVKVVNQYNSCPKDSISKEVDVVKVINSTTTDSWNKKKTWDCNCVPTPSTFVRIKDGHTVDLKNDREVSKLIVENGGQLQMGGSGFTVTGDLTVNGDIRGENDFILKGSGTTIEGGGKIVLCQNGNSANLKISGGNKTISAVSNLKVSVQSFDLQSYTLTNKGKVDILECQCANGDLTGGDNSSWINKGNATLNVAPTIQIGSLVASDSGNTVNYSGKCKQTIVQPASSYWHLQATGAKNKTFKKDLDVNGDLTITSKMKEGTSGINKLNLAGDWTNTGIYKEGNGTVVFDGASDQSFNATDGDTLNNMTTDKGGGVLVLNDNATVSNTLTMAQGNIDASSDTLELGTGCGNPGSLSRTSGTVIGKFERWVENPPKNDYLFPVGTAGNYRPGTMTFNTVSSCGSVVGEFIASGPGNDGLPLDDGISPDSVQNTFSEGYWVFNSRNGFSTSDHDVTVEANGFTSFSINSSTRLLYRGSAGDPWTTDGTHAAASGNTINRDNLTNGFLAHYAVGDTNRCDKPNIPAITGRDSVCVDETGVIYEAVDEFDTLKSLSSSYNSYVNGYNLDSLRDGKKSSGTIWGGSVGDSTVLTATFLNEVVLDTLRVRSGQHNGDFNRPDSIEVYRGSYPGGAKVANIVPDYTWKTYTISNNVAHDTYFFVLHDRDGGNAADGYIGVREMDLGDDQLTYNWSVDGGSVFSGQGSDSITVNWGSTGGKGAVKVKGENSCAWSPQTVDSVNIHSISPASISGDDPVPENTTHTYSVDGRTGYTYNWTVIGGTLASGQGTDSITVDWGSAGTGEVRVEAESSCDTADPVSKFVTIYGTIISIASDKWEKTSTWDCGCVPTGTDNAIVDKGHTVTQNNDRKINHFVIRATGTLNSKGNQLNVNGDYTLKGRHEGNGDIYFDGIGTVIDGTGTITTNSVVDVRNGDKTIPDTASISLTDGAVEFNVSNKLTVTNKGEVNIFGKLTGGSNKSEWVNEVGAILRVKGSILSSNGKLDAAADSNTVCYCGGGDQTVIRSKSHYHHLTLDTSGTKSANGNLDIDGDLTISSSGESAQFKSNGYKIELAGNWLDNHGTDGFVEGTGTVILDGDTAQKIQTTNVADETFYRLRLNKPDGHVTGKTDVVISDSLTLLDGLLDVEVPGNKVIFQKGSKTNGGTSTSFVDGVVRKNGNSAFKFPVGDTIGSTFYWARMGISATKGSNNVTFEAEYIAEEHSDFEDTDATLNNVSDREHWILNRTSGSDSVKVTLHWEDSAWSGINDPSDLVVARHDGSQWTSEGQGSVTNDDPGDVTSNGYVKNYSPFTFGSLSALSNPLPVELLSFDAKARNEVVDVVWKTATETGNDFFTVERSRDGKNFDPIGTVEGAGNSNSIQNYAFTDQDPYTGTSYYRLRQTDFNGANEVTEPVAVEFRSQGVEPSIGVFPNPTGKGSDVNVSLEGFKGKEVLVVLRDVLGKKYYSKVVITKTTGRTLTAVDIKNRIPSGVYLITATSNDKIYKKKLVIE